MMKRQEFQEHMDSMGRLAIGMFWFGVTIGSVITAAALLILYFEG
jgi:hypothetical protein